MDGVIKSVIAATDVIQPLILWLLSIPRLYFLDFYVDLNPSRLNMYFVDKLPYLVLLCYICIVVWRPRP